MISEKLDRYRKMLENERSFDRLFSEEFRGKDFLFYYDKAFSDDPIFNHAVPAESVLGSKDVPPNKISDIFEEVRGKARELRVPASVFVEEFWPNARRFETTGIEAGYRVIEKMNVLSKDLVSVAMDSSQVSRVTIVQTTDSTGWIEVFMRSFGISEPWRGELERRGEKFAKEPSTSLLLAYPPGGGNNASGCLLLHLHPPECAGIYCVGTVPERRYQGVGNALMWKAESLALEKKCHFAVLQTVNSDGVTPMYLKLGYHVDFDRVVMQSAI